MPEMTAKQIHIDWEGPFSYEDAKKDLKDDKKDFGVYQIYGGHPLYGSGVLLYIGKAEQQTFSRRLSQEQWGEFNRDSGNVEVYIGRLSGRDKPTETEWKALISVAEKLLIYAHHPASNSSNLNSLPDAARQFHIFNWGQFRDLMAEVSGMRWTSFFYDTDFDSDDWETYSL